MALLVVVTVMQLLVQYRFVMSFVEQLNSTNEIRHHKPVTEFILIPSAQITTPAFANSRAFRRSIGRLRAKTLQAVFNIEQMQKCISEEQIGLDNV